MIVGGQMTTLTGEDIDYSGEPLNKGGLVASIGVEHKAILERLPNWDPDKHWETHIQSHWFGQVVVKATGGGYFL